MRRVHLTWLFVVSFIVLLSAIFWPTSESEQKQPQASISAPNPNGSNSSPEQKIAAEESAPNEMPPAISSPALQEFSIPVVDNSSDVEVCGVGTVRLDLTNNAAVGKYADSLIEEAYPRWASALRQSKDIHAKALGLALQARLEVRNAIDEMERRLGPCPETDETCQRPRRNARFEISDRGAPELTEELVGLANSTRDPAIYALGVHLCKASPSLGGPCHSISIEQWTEIDPDNAVPWIAKSRVIPTYRTARSDAAERASKAKTINFYNSLFYRASLSSLPTDISELQRSILTRRLVNFEMSRRIEVDMPFCMPPWNADRQVACGLLAELYSSHATTLQDKTVAWRIGRSLPSLAEKARQLLIERDALSQAQFEALKVDTLSEWPRNPFSCAAIQKQNAYFEKLAALGEVAAARELLDKSGVSIEEMARRAAARIEKEKEMRGISTKPQ